MVYRLLKKSTYDDRYWRLCARFQRHTAAYNVLPLLFLPILPSCSAAAAATPSRISALCFAYFYSGQVKDIFSGAPNTDRVGPYFGSIGRHACTMPRYKAAAEIDSYLTHHH